jgi:hypothetical protein
MPISVLDLIMYGFAHNDDYLTGTFGHANKKKASRLEVPTRLRGDSIEYNEELLKAMGDDKCLQMAGELCHLALGHPDRLKAIIGTADELRPLAEIAFMLATYHTLEHDNRPVDEQKFLKPSTIKGPDGRPLPNFLSAEEYFALLLQKMDKEGIELPDPQQGQGQGQPQSGQGQGTADLSDETNGPPQEGEGQGQGEGQPQDGQGQGEGQGQQQDQGQQPSQMQQMAKSLGFKGPIQNQDTTGWGNVPKVLQEQMKLQLKQELQKSRGTLPAGLTRVLEQLELEEQEDWKRIIDRMTGSKFATRRFKCDPKRASRRYGIGFFGRKKIKRGALVYAIDTSGSMADHEMAVCVANGKHLAARYGAPFLVLVCDAAIQATKLIKKSVDLDQVDMIGGGGTSSLPVFDYLKEHQVQADLLVYFTDLYIDFPHEKPANVTDMVWAVINNENPQEVPFGEIVHVEIPEVKG